MLFVGGPQPVMGQVKVLKSSHLFSTWGSFTGQSFSGTPLLVGWNIVTSASQSESLPNSASFTLSSHAF